MKIEKRNFNIHVSNSLSFSDIRLKQLPKHEETSHQRSNLLIFILDIFALVKKDKS